MVKNNGSKPLRSGALAMAAGVSPDTIRHYERIGVLPPALRTEPGYREYPANALERVLVVRRAIGIGFTLAELAEVLKALERNSARADQPYCSTIFICCSFIRPPCTLNSDKALAISFMSSVVSTSLVDSMFS